jgi:hypothetical protein
MEHAPNRPRWRRRAAALFSGTVVAAQVALALNGYRDPHRTFAFQPFAESTTWRAEIVRVTWEGERIPVDDDWVYRWDDLVDFGPLQHLRRDRDAAVGAAASIDFLDEALDWVARHTPRDDETRFIEATVVYVENAHGPRRTVLRSVERARS